jgi:hypothetical protein
MKKELLAGKDISPATFNLLAVLSACCLVSCGFLVYFAFAIRWALAIRVGILALAFLLFFFSVMVLKVKARYCALLRLFRTNEISRITLASAVDAEKASAIAEVKDARTIEKLKENQEVAIQKTAGAVASQVSRNIGDNVSRMVRRELSEQEERMESLMNRIEQLLGGSAPYRAPQDYGEEEYLSEEEDYSEPEEEPPFEEEEEEQAEPVDLV